MMNKLSYCSDKYNPGIYNLKFKREEWWTSRESLWLPATGTCGYPIWAYRC